MREFLYMTMIGLMLTPFTGHAQNKIPEKLKVIASFSIIGDMVKEIAGDKIDLKVLVGPNGDTHEYEPTTADAKAIASADLVFMNGLGLEGWLGRLIQSSGYKNDVVGLSRGVKILQVGNVEDPHAWQDIANGKIYVENIRAALCAHDKANAAFYTHHADDYIAKLDALDKWVKAQIASVPAEKRKVISTHDAFQYFARAYHIEFLAPVGANTESQASATDMARLIDQIRAQKITAVFFENMTDSRLIKQLEEDAGAHVGGTLYSDALSSASEAAPTYIGMFKYNVPELVRAMQNNP